MTGTDALLTRLRHLDGEVVDRRPDLRAPATLALGRDLADRLLAETTDVDRLWALEQASTSPETGAGLSRPTQLAVKLARSRAFLLGGDRALTVSVVIPAYSETVRLRPRGSGPGQDPDGEDFVVQKSAQLEWLFAGTSASYRVLFVDDMSKPEPETSGDAIARVVAENGVDRFDVVFLADGVRTEKTGDTLVAAALRGVELPKNTRKAGAVYYGVATAIEAAGRGDDHVVVLTDCDLSVDLGQLGNLLAPIVAGGAVAAAGSRRLPESVLEIEAARNTRANAARYFRELLLTGLLPRDTQCGAKAFSAEALATVVGAGMEVLDFSFDIELLTRTALAFGPARIVPVPVAWFDSSELTTTDSSVHFGIMRAQLAIARANRTGSGEVFDAAVALAGALTADERVWLRFLDRLAGEPALLEGIQRFDPALLPDLERLTRD
jgi:Glycosyl transferase family 2